MCVYAHMLGNKQPTSKAQAFLTIREILPKASKTPAPQRPRKGFWKKPCSPIFLVMYVSLVEPSMLIQFVGSDEAESCVFLEAVQTRTPSRP